MSDDRVTEYRVALVLNGGVSLAVWMSGAVKEIDLIRRASCAEGPPADATENDLRHYDTWRAIAAKKGIRVVVDVVAGTSAGGLNGALLAMALACDADLPDLKQMWRTQAALTSDALLSTKDELPRRSVLSGRHLTETLEEKLTGLCGRVAPGTPRPITLFVTATALGQSNLQYRDVAGKSFDVADHRCLYRFSTTHLPDLAADGKTFVPTVRNDFVEDVAALVVAARASAGYPAAFAPVRETPLLHARRHPPDPHEPSDPQSEPDLPWLMDGGILDNAPIEPVIEEIGHRVPNGPITRVLAYIVPSNGVVARTTIAETGTERTAPNWVGVVGSALDFPRESDFRHDVTAIKDAIGADRSRGQTSLALLSRAVVSEDVRAALAAAAEALVVPYRASRIEGSLRAIREGSAERAQDGPKLEPAPVGSGMAHRATHAAWVPAENTTAAQVTGAATWPFGFSGARRTVRLLLAAVRTDLDGGRDLVDVAKALSEIDDEITVLEKAVSATVEQGAQEAEAKVEAAAQVMGRRATRADMDAALTELINQVFGDRDVATLLTDRMNAAVHRYADCYELPTGLDAAGLRRILAAIEIVTGAASGDSEGQDPPPFQFVRLGPDVDSTLYPMEDRGGSKLYGTSLGHFGAFANETWRDCDFTWGRLDATAHVAKLLDLDEGLTRSLEVEVVASEGWAGPETFEESTGGAGADFAATLKVLVKSRQGRAVLGGVARSAAGLIGHQGRSIAADIVRRVVRHVRGSSTPPAA